MKVIRDSPRMNKKREDLERLKREILNMNLDHLSKRKNNNLELNKFLSQRESEVSFNL